ncbi:MAG: lytic transglycosylase domain-containing protein [Flavipsychrobacter sp.]|nr:lytic transglycosylase domain-containing protein [Flavipsychrobacter sp.]
MHCKGFLLAISLSFISITSYGQRTLPIRRDGGQVLRVDTIVIKKGVTPASELANCSIPKGGNLVNGYKPIPLAGQKSYFGDMDEYVTSFVRQYFMAHNKTLNFVQDKSPSSFSLMDNVLLKNDIPKELKYLAVIESALNYNAVSNAGAVGPWQFMESTAKLMGLTVNKKRDDRKDLYKSTGAAAKYLGILYNQLNDWLLVIAAYNSGPGVVQRAIDRTGSRNFWDIKKYLPRETQGHVLAFIATATIFENLSKFIGLGDIPENFRFDNPKGSLTDAKKAGAPSPFTPEELKNMSIIHITEPLSLELMAMDLGVDKKLLIKWNPDYDLFIYNTYPSKDYALRIPKDKVDLFIQKKPSLEKRSKQIYSDMVM